LPLAIQYACSLPLLLTTAAAAAAAAADMGQQ
jgi:hypothetical protein